MATEAVLAHRDVSSTKKIFISDTIEEPEINSINFRQSLKFFQEQLSINGNSFPSPNPLITSENISRHANNINGTQNKQETSEKTNEKELFRKGLPELNNSKIQIPTVDTILESVRVLRAIQKSQEERNAIWNLNSTSQIETNLDDQLFESIKNLNNVENKHSFEILYEKKQNLNAVITNNSNVAGKTVHPADISNSSNKKCSFWPSNNILREKIYGNDENKIENTEDSTENKIPSYEDMKHQILLESKNASASTKTGMHKSRPVLESASNCFNNLQEPNALENVLEHDQSTLTGFLNGSITEDSNDTLHSIENRNFKITDLSQENLKAQYIIAFVTEPSSPNPNSIDVQSNQLSSAPKIFLSSYSTEEHNVKKLGSFDGDSGIGTQRSPISSCSPTTQRGARKDSWSDTCSSLYVSAECSPCPSLSSLFDSSLGFNSYMPSLTTDSLDAEYQENVWEEDAFETQVRDVFIACKDDNITDENKILKEQPFHSFSCNPIHNASANFHHVDDVSNHYEAEEVGTSEQANACDCPDPNIISNNGEEISKQSKVLNSCANDIYFSSVSNANELSFCSAAESSDLYQVASESPTEAIEHNDANTSHSFEIDKEEISSQQKKLSSLPIKSSDNLANNETRDEKNYNSTICTSPNAEIQNDDNKHPESQGMSSNNKKCAENSDDEETPIINEEEEEKNSDHSFCSFNSIELKLSLPDISKVQQECENYETNKNNDSLSYETFKSTEESLIHIDDQYAAKENDDVSESKNFTNKENEVNGKDVDIEVRQKKITSASWNVISITESLYEMMEYTAENVYSQTQDFEKNVFVLSKGAFSAHQEGIYHVSLQNSSLTIKSIQDSEIVCSIALNHIEVKIGDESTLMLDNKMGRCLYFHFEEMEEIEGMIKMKEELEMRSLQHWQFECIKLVHYPLKCHQDVVIIDLGSCSTRAGILMDQPTLPTLFFPTICAKDKTNGKCVYGMEALQSEVRKNSILSFPVRTPEKINKHTIDIDVLGGLFEKIFKDLGIDATKYTVQLCLPRSINTSTQNALMKLLLEDLKVEAVSLTNQALLTLYAHDVSTAVIVDVGNRMDILPVVDGFIVENGVTKLPYGGQRIIHHMKHALASKHMSLSSEIDSFMVEYIMENAAYIAQDFENEVKVSAAHPDMIKKSITLQQFGKDNSMLEISLDDARFKISEGLFKPELWGLDNQGIHQLVQKAIQATSVDARKRVAESIYVSGGVTMLPGFVERLSKEVSKLSKTKVMPKVFASKYRYHCTYIGACKFASMKEFPQVCINLEEYSKDRVASLKKFVLCI